MNDDYLLKFSALIITILIIALMYSLPSVIEYYHLEAFVRKCFANLMPFFGSVMIFVVLYNVVKMFIRDWFV